MRSETQRDYGPELRNLEQVRSSSAGSLEKSCFFGKIS